MTEKQRYPYDIYYYNDEHNKVYLKRKEELEVDAGLTDCLNGYLVDCTDGETYLVFAPNRSYIRHFPVYENIFKMHSDFTPTYDPLGCVRPAYTNVYNEVSKSYKILRVGWEFFGRVYRVLPDRNYDDIIRGATENIPDFIGDEDKCNS